MIAWRPTSWKAMFCAECARGAGDRYGRDHAFGIARGPLQRLHAAHRSAGDAKQLLDAQRIEQHGLGAHHVADGDQRKGKAVRFARRGIDFGRSARAHAAADDIGADDEEAVGVDGLAGPHHGFPPARLAGDGMGAGHELVAGQRMADQHRVAACGVQLAIGHIGDGPRRQRAPAVQRERLVGPEMDRLAFVRVRRRHRPQEFWICQNLLDQPPGKARLLRLYPPVSTKPACRDTGSRSC